MKIEAGPWSDVDQVRLGADGKLRMPDTGRVPGVYRFRLTGGEAPSIYIGESEDLSRRFGQYRHPEPSQRTNVRIHKRILEHLKAGGIVAVAVVTEAVLRVGESQEPMEFGRRTSRLLVEEHLIDEAREAGMTVDNLS
jgi:hypothetical protein